MKLLDILAQVSAFQLAIAICASVLSGVAELGATICVLESLRTGAVLWWQFAAVAFFSIIIGRYSRLSLARLASKSIVRMRRQLVRSVLHVPLTDLERIGPTRLLVAFTSDLVGVASAARNIASLAASSAILLGCLAYIGWYSRAIMVVTALLCVVCLGGAVVLRRFEKQHRLSARQGWDRVVEVFSMVLEGVKQLKLNRSLARRVLLSFEHRVREQQQSAGTRALYSDLVATWMQTMFYVILGVAVFGPFGSEVQLKLGFAFLALLMIRRALRSIVGDSSAIADASVAFQRITDVGLTVSEDKRERDSARPAPDTSHDWRRLDLKGVQFRYRSGNRQDNFVLGPVEITLRPGEVVFITGSNGSGKTTLAKVLTGLYAPTSGTIRFDGVAVNERNSRWYRSKFAAVFADFCLFEGVADLQRNDLDREAQQLAIRLKLNRWMLGGLESPGKSSLLSSGERGRIVLLKAVIEDRKVLVLDEWAADQDSHYKQFFYEEFLPKLRKSGKLVVVISHDEEYFHAADRVLRLERGEPPTWTSSSSAAKPSDVSAGMGDLGAAAATAIDT